MRTASKGEANLARFDRGGALLAVLWLSAALAAVALSVASTVRSETGRVAVASEAIRAHYLATGSIERAILWIIWGAAYRNPDGSPRFYEPPMPRIHMRYPSGEVVVEVIPESSKLSVNEATPDDLFRLLRVLGADEARARLIVSAILDWRSPAAGLTPFDQQYLAFNLPGAPTFRARHASLEEIEELLLVRGMTPELFYASYVEDEQGRLIPRGGLKDCLSVYGSTSGFDVNTADPALLAWLGLSPEAVRLIVERRHRGPIRNLAELGPLAHPRLTIGGNVMWTLRATARLRRPDGSLSEVRRTSSALVKFLRPEQFQPPYHILRWYDDAWSPSAAEPISYQIPVSYQMPGVRQ